MKSRMVAIARAFAALMLLCMLATAEHALAQPRAFVFGGSGFDRMASIAAGPGERIVMTGSAGSIDGLFMWELNDTLTDVGDQVPRGAGMRLDTAEPSTSDFGDAGWVLCVDARGNVLWSVFTPSALSAPVLHEDGNLTAVMRRRGDDGEAPVVVRINGDGQIAAQQPVLAPRGRQMSVYFKWATPEGYWFEAYSDSTTDSSDVASYFFLVRWDGETICDDELPGTYRGLAAYTERHIIRIDEPEKGREGGLYALDEAGNQTRLADAICANQSNYTDLISLEDGGAAASGWVLTDGIFKGRLTRWDAQGKLVFDWWMDDPLSELARTQNGFVATANVLPDTIDWSENTEEWKLVFFDENGIRNKEWQLGTASNLGMDGWPFTKGFWMAQLSDGSIALLANRFGAPGNLDVWLTIIPKEDLR